MTTPGPIGSPSRVTLPETSAPSPPPQQPVTAHSKVKKTDRPIRVAIMQRDVAKDCSADFLSIASSTRIQLAHVSHETSIVGDDFTLLPSRHRSGGQMVDAVV